MSNVTIEEERVQLMEAAGKAPKVLDDKEVTLTHSKSWQVLKSMLN